MYRYTVVDTNRLSRLVALRDPAGRYHVAHCSSDLPDIESVLDGALPKTGFAMLLGTTGKGSRLTFSQINCGQAWALGLLHPEEPLPDTYQRDSTSLTANTSMA